MAPVAACCALCCADGADSLILLCLAPEQSGRPEPMRPKMIERPPLRLVASRRRFCSGNVRSRRGEAFYVRNALRGVRALRSVMPWLCATSIRTSEAARSSNHSVQEESPLRIFVTVVNTVTEFYTLSRSRIHWERTCFSTDFVGRL
eukprot:6193383-Pleurochrysis_carterae.AAC.2